MAAKSKYCPEIVERITAIIEAGNFAITAYTAVNISHETYYGWMKEKPEFAEAIAQAESKAEMTALAAVQSDPSWQSKAWYLERKFKDRWSKTENHNINNHVEPDRTITILKAEDQTIENG